MTSSAFRRNFSADFGAEGFAFRRTICGDCLGCSRRGWSAQQICFSATHLWRHTWRLATGIMRGSGAKDGWVAGDGDDARGFEDQTALWHRDWPMVVVDFLLIQNYLFRSNSAPASLKSYTLSCLHGQISSEKNKCFERSALSKWICEICSEKVAPATQLRQICYEKSSLQRLPWNISRSICSQTVWSEKSAPESLLRKQKKRDVCFG